jgi:peptidoglycan hydrolase-like protein with peptidoglycan-binding domain
MESRFGVWITRAAGVSLMACLALCCLPAAGMAAADKSAAAAQGGQPASGLLARGAGYGQPRGAAGVRVLQRRLRALGLRPGPVDGRYGPLTEAAVVQLQRDSGLAADGVVGPQTRRVLEAETAPLVPGAGYGRPAGSQRVRAAQRKLRSLELRPGPLDGVYGPRTQAAVGRFQRTAGQAPDGVLSVATARVLANADGDRPATVSRDAGHRDARPAKDQPRQSDNQQASERTDRNNNTQSPESAAVPEQSDGTKSSLVVALLALVLAAVGGLLLWWQRRRRREPEGVTAPRPVTPRVPPKAQEANGRPDDPQSAATEQGPVALGYVSAPGPALEGPEVDAQLAAISAACAERGLVLGPVVRDVAAGDASVLRRPGMREAARCLAGDEASCLVVAGLGRLSGSAAEVGRIVEWLGRRGARLVAVEEGLDTGTDSGRAAAAKLVLLCAFGAQLQPPRPSAELDTVPQPQPPQPTKPGNGNGGGQRPPALRGRIRALRAGGLTLQAIADRLNAEKVPTPRGGIWRPSSVQSALRQGRPNTTPVGNGQNGDSNGSAEPGPKGAGRPTSRRKEGATR